MSTDTPFEQQPGGSEEVLPFDDDALDGPPIDSFGPKDFLYIGEGLVADEFTAYVQSYDFGTIPPDFVVLHHTAIPSTLHARYPSGGVWDAGEEGKSEAQIKRRRKAKLDGIRDVYMGRPGWDRGPHLFLDDRYIWLFSPMREIGIHAKQGNGYREGGRLHYSIGIEVVGYYERVHWPAPVERLVGHAVAALKRRLGTFELRYQPRAGGISSHRDYNKPQCPGAAIGERYYIEVLQRGWAQLNAPSAPVVTDASKPAASGTSKPAAAGAARRISADAPILGPPSGRLEQVVAFVQARLPADSEYANDVAKIMGYYWTYAPAVGVDPFLAAAQCVMETGGLTSHWAGRPRRNPAGLGVHQEGGYSFASWEQSVQAHLGQLLAFALRDEEATEAQRRMMAKNPRHSLIPAEQRGVARTLAGLARSWANDPGYPNKIARRANAILGG